MHEKLVEARRLMEESYDTSPALGLLALKGAIYQMLEYLEETTKPPTPIANLDDMESEDVKQKGCSTCKYVRPDEERLYCTYYMDKGGNESQADNPELGCDHYLNEHQNWPQELEE